MKDEGKCKRSPRFTNDEIMLLLSLLKKRKSSVENNLDATCLNQKKNAWMDIANEYNITTSGCVRTVDNLQHCYRILKKIGTRRKSISKNNISHLEHQNFGTCHELSPGLKDEKSESDILSKEKEKCGVLICKVRNLVRASFDDCYTVFYDNSNESHTLRKEENDAIGKVRDLIRVLVDDCYTLFDESAQTFIDDHATECETDSTLKNSSDPPLNQKVSLLTSEKLELVLAQKKLLKLKLTEEREKLEHNRILRKMEIEEKEEKCNHARLLSRLEAEDALKKYAHNEMLRKLQFQKYSQLV